MQDNHHQLSFIPRPVSLGDYMSFILSMDNVPYKSWKPTSSTGPQQELFVDNSDLLQHNVGQDQTRQ